MPNVSAPPHAQAIEFANLGYAAADAAPELEQWLLARLPHAALDDGSLRALATMQACVHVVLDRCIEDRMSAAFDAVEVLNHASEAVPVSPVLVVTSDGRLSATTAHGITDVSGVMAEISRSAIDLVTTFADRLRRCDGPGCGRYFLRDRAHRTWCSLGCGNRARVARHYSQHTVSARGDGGCPAGARAGATGRGDGAVDRR
jgi:predicted RNA-binding Zn ribbon-like protein